VSLDLRCFSNSRTETAVLQADAVYLSIEGGGGRCGGCPWPTVRGRSWHMAAGLRGLALWEQKSYTVGT